MLRGFILLKPVITPNISQILSEARASVCLGVATVNFGDEVQSRCLCNIVHSLVEFVHILCNLRLHYLRAQRCTEFVLLEIG